MSHCVQSSIRLPCASHDRDDVLPAIVDARLAGVEIVAGVLPSGPNSAPGGLAVVASRSGRRNIGNSMLGPICGSRIVCCGRLMTGQLAALEDEDAVRALGEHALSRAPRPRFVAGQRRQRLRPWRDVVRTEDILSALFARHGRRRSSAARLTLDRRIHDDPRTRTPARRTRWRRQLDACACRAPPGSTSNYQRPTPNYAI